MFFMTKFCHKSEGHFANRPKDCSISTKINKEPQIVLKDSGLVSL